MKHVIPIYIYIYIHLQYAHVLIHAFRHASTHHTIWSHAYNDWNTVTDTRLASYWIAVDAMTWNFVTWHDKHPCMNAYIQSHKYTYCVYTYVYSFCFLQTLIYIRFTVNYFYVYIYIQYTHTNMHTKITYIILYIYVPSYIEFTCLLTVRVLMCCSTLGQAYLRVRHQGGSSYTGPSQDGFTADPGQSQQYQLQYQWSIHWASCKNSEALSRAFSRLVSLWEIRRLPPARRFRSLWAEPFLGLWACERSEACERTSNMRFSFILIFQHSSYLLSNRNLMLSCFT